ncbi:MAG TPA: LON peptidase substrate-binding domain-containing protein [Gemmatimonadaceae bacterium]|nr:LON peptidase substrate-binding domain-containing protein [Gemmatimonadaceae bacterium]
MDFDRLPLFPLPVVLFPGTALPLHIFEPRYRQLLADSLEREERFGIARLPEGVAELELPPGTVGCVAEIVTSETLPDGRSNIIVRGMERFAFASFVSSPHPYHVCSAVPVEDEFEIGAELDTLAERVRDVFRRVARAARTLSDDPDPLPDLPEDSASLSFAIASMIDIGLDARQEILSSRSPLERLRHLDGVLSAALGTIVDRAQAHTLAKTNGRGAHLEK